MSKVKYIALFAVLLMSAAHANNFTCTLTTPTLNFPNYDTLDQTPTRVTGIITVACHDDRKFSYTLSLAAGGGGSFSPRRMLHGLAHINYNLYYNNFPPAGTIWGDGSGGSSIYRANRVQCHEGNNPCQTVVYGNIPAMQNVGPGLYTDHICVTLTY